MGDYVTCCTRSCEISQRKHLLSLDDHSLKKIMTNRESRQEVKVITSPICFCFNILGFDHTDIMATPEVYLSTASHCYEVFTRIHLNTRIEPCSSAIRSLSLPCSLVCQVRLKILRISLCHLFLIRMFNSALS